MTDADGQRLIFSVLQNGYVNFNAKTVEDQIAIRVAEFGHGAAAARGAPRAPADPAVASAVPGKGPQIEHP